MHARAWYRCGRRPPSAGVAPRACAEGEGDGRVRIGGEWIWLGIAGLSEVVWTILLKYTEGFTRLAPSLATVAAMAVSFYYMSRALQALPIGTVYTVWTGTGAAGAAVWGMAVEGDPATALRILCLALILAGAAGLKLAQG